MKIRLTLLAAVFGLFVLAPVKAFAFERLSAQFSNFDGTETLSNVAAIATGAGGSLVYSKSVFVPFLSGGATLYITISAVGDNHKGESNDVSCNIDGPSGVGSATTVCNPTPTSTGIDGAPPGWTTLTHHFAYETTYGSNGTTGLSAGDGGGGTSDEHDNDYYYTWCKRVGAGTHTVNLRLGNHSGASSPVPGGNTFVFFEKAFYYIDVSPTPVFGGCTKAVTPTKP